MSKTWYGHYIETLKGEDYVLHKDYTELQNKLEKEIERLNNIIDELEKWIDKNKQYQVISERCIVWEDKLIDKLNELKGDNK